MSTTDETREVCGIEIKSDFPNRAASPDPANAIQQLVDHGTWVDAAKNLPCSARTLRRWGSKYPEIEEAYMKGSMALGAEAEQTLVLTMRGQKPPEAHEDAEAPTASAILGAAKKLVSINHHLKDYSASQTIIRKEPGKDSEEVEKKVEEMDEDELLDQLNELTNE